MCEKMVKTLLQQGLIVNAEDMDNSSLLNAAVKKKHLKKVKDLLKYGADVNMLNNSRFGGCCTPLHSAVKDNSTKMAKLLIKHGANVNAKDSDGKTAIVYAISHTNTEMIKLLLIKGADIKEDLYSAVENGNLEIVKVLLQCGANVHMLIRTKCGTGTPLHSAVHAKQVEIAKLLIQYGANVNVKDSLRTTPIAYAIQNDDTEMTKLLLNSGADIKDNPTLLCTAVENGSLKIVEDLLKDGADVNMLISSKFGSGITLLHSAVHMKQVEMAKLLKNYGANVNVKDSLRTTAIAYAIQNDDTEMFKLLINNGAAVKDNPTLLCTAVENGSLKIVEDLLKEGADVNMLGSSKFGKDVTPLHSAASVKQIEMAKLLIHYGANVNVKDSRAKTPIVYAIKNGNTEMTELLLINGAVIKEDPNLLYTAVEKGNRKILEVLLKYGADVNLLANLRSGRAFTPLHSAVKGKQILTAELLISHGANVNVKDTKGATPIVYAIENRDIKMTQLLLVNGADIKKDPNLLCIAVWNESWKIIVDLLKYGADVNIVTSSKFGSDTPLNIAVHRKHVELAKLLIKYGANVNVKDSLGTTPIVNAIISGDTELVELLLINGADINEHPRDTPWREHSRVLCTAVGDGCSKHFEDPQKDGVDVNKLTTSRLEADMTPLHIALHWKQVEMVKLLIYHGANVNFKDTRGYTPIDYTIENRDTEMTKLLLTYGADIKNNPNLLCTAVCSESLEIVEDLLKHGADVNMSTSSEFRRNIMPLNIAVRSKQVGMAKLLIKYGANVNVKNVKGKTPIIYAIKNEDTEMTEMLLINGAVIKDNPNLLYTAVKKGSLKIIKVLLKYGADVNMLTSSKFGRSITPLHTAVDRKQVEIVELMLNYGANVNVKDAQRNITPLNIAVHRKHVEMAKLLINYGANVNVENGKGKTPIVYAIKNGDTEMTELLLINGADIKGNPKVLYALCPTTELLKQHIAKVKAAGLYVSERNLTWISTDYEINNFMNRCEAEIEIMKSEKCSFYDILTKNTSELAKNESIVQALKSDDYKTKFPIYASMIDSRFRRGVEREELLGQVRNHFLYSFFGSLSELPLSCTERIFSYLNDKDLRILLVACKLFDK